MNHSNNQNYTTEVPPPSMINIQKSLKQQNSSFNFDSHQNTRTEESGAMGSLRKTSVSSKKRLRSGETKSTPISKSPCNSLTVTPLLEVISIEDSNDEVVIVDDESISKKIDTSFPLKNRIRKEQSTKPVVSAKLTPVSLLRTRYTEVRDPLLKLTTKDLTRLARMRQREKTSLDIECPICMELVNKPASTICGHIFCEDCVRSAVISVKKCPNCRNLLTLDDFHRIFV